MSTRPSTRSCDFSRRARVARASGLCANRGCPGDPPRGVSAANDAKGGEGAVSARPQGKGPLASEASPGQDPASGPQSDEALGDMEAEAGLALEDFVIVILVAEIGGPQ